MFGGGFPGTHFGGRGGPLGGADLEEILNMLTGGEGIRRR
jgi:hypothetical protein